MFSLFFTCLPELSENINTRYLEVFFSLIPFAFSTSLLVPIASLPSGAFGLYCFSAFRCLGALVWASISSGHERVDCLLQGGKGPTEGLAQGRLAGLLRWGNCVQ